MSNPFHLPADSYTRDLKFIDGAHQDYAKYLSLHTGDPFEQCLEFVKAQTRPGGLAALNSPKTLVLDKSPNGDREARTVGFMQFISRVEKQDLLLSPSMAAYMPESKRKSTHAIYIEEGVKGRKTVKKQMFNAQQALARQGLAPMEIDRLKDEVVFTNGAQNNLKINNNSYSGGTVSQATILHYKSTHSSLTSTCRTATSYANANNEKFIAGNRHYYSPEITKANLLFIMTNSDLDLIERVCQRLGLKFPSVDDVCAMVEYSSQNYWQSPMHMGLIRTMLLNTTPAERAAVMYVGDMYQLFCHNREAITQFLMQLSSTGDASVDVADEVYKGYDDDLTMLATFLCFEEVRGRSMKDVASEDPQVINLVKATAKQASDTLMAYQDFIQAFFLSTVMPSSIHAFPTIYRKAVPISDTDSTMFTLQWWVEQIFGEVVFTAEAKRVVFALVFLISEVVMHLLALMSTNMGVKAAKLRLLAMKNEYYFAVLCLTTRSKHYFASRDAQEGVMKAKPEQETKGVGLRDSKVPPKVQKMAKATMIEIVNTVKACQKINLTKILTQVADIERSIIASLEHGSFEYLTTAQIKTASSYKSDDNHTFKQWELWRDVFAPSFGETMPPPYSVVKVSLAINNKTDMQTWFDKMENPQLVERFKAWLLHEGKTEVSTLLIPASVVEGQGIPKAITCAIDVRNIISNTMPTFYLMLESLGVFLTDNRNARLVSDYY